MEQDDPYKEHHIKKELDAVYDRCPREEKTLHSIKIRRTEPEWEGCNYVE